MRPFSFSRTVGVLALMLAWLTLSNHCALALLESGRAAEMAELHKCCSGVPKDNQQAPAMPVGGCCKSLRVLAQDAPAKLVHAQENVLLYELLFSTLQELPQDADSLRGAAAATGPPELKSFAEVVLQRSVLSHAPPFLG